MTNRVSNHRSQTSFHNCDNKVVTAYTYDLNKADEVILKTSSQRNRNTPTHPNSFYFSYIPLAFRI